MTCAALCLLVFGAVLSYSGTVHAFSCIEYRSIANRRDIFYFTQAGLISTLIANPSPALATELDLSQYKDGPRGLKFVVTSDGTGITKPQRGQQVKTSYSLFLYGFPEDGGKQVDSSKGFFGDKPFEFHVGVSEVIKGWDLVLMDMVEGESRRLVIPSALGYGDKGAGGMIPGGSTLYFEVHLIENGQLPELNDGQRKWLEEHPM